MHVIPKGPLNQYKLSYIFGDGAHMEIVFPRPRFAQPVSENITESADV